MSSRLLEATGVNLSPVFGVYAGAGGPAAVLDGVTATEPALDLADETGVRHRLWVVAEPDRIANVPRTGPSPNMCRVRNVTCDWLASIS